MIVPVSVDCGFGKTWMREVIMVALTVLSASAAVAETDNFDAYARGAEPEGWTCGVTGKGTPKWTVDTDQ